MTKQKAGENIINFDCLKADSPYVSFAKVENKACTKVLMQNILCEVKR
jgi:hypothetical protein